MIIGSKAAQEIKKLLPHGGLITIQERLAAKGKIVSYETVKRFTNPEVIEEAFNYLQELKEEKKGMALADHQLVKSLRHGFN